MLLQHYYSIITVYMDVYHKEIPLTINEYVTMVTVIISINYCVVKLPVRYTLLSLPLVCLKDQFIQINHS